MDDRHMTLRQWVYQRSLRKNIGVLEAIDELLAEATQPDEAKRLEALRLTMAAWRAQRGRSPSGAQPPTAEAVPPRSRRSPMR